MAKQSFSVGQVLTAAQMTSLQQTAMLGGSTTAKTTSYTLVAADAGTVVSVNSTSSTTITINTALFSAGDVVTIQNWGTGSVTITAGTATVNTAGSLIVPQYDGGVLYFTSTSTAIYFDFVQAGAVSPLTTKGDLYGFGSSDARIPIGTNGHILTADSTQTLGLKWSAPAGGGKVLQVVQATTGTTTNVNTTGYIDITNVTASITPSVATSKVLIMISLPYSVGNTTGVDCGIGVKIVRASTDILEDDSCGGLTAAGLGNFNLGLGNVLTLTFLDSPATTSSTAYKLMGKRHRGNNCVFNSNEFTAATASVILMEIGA
jgi:hypothetical protein